MESKEEIHINIGIYIYTRRIKENRGAGQRVEKHPQAGKSLSVSYIYIFGPASVYSRTLFPQCECCWTQLAKVQSRVVYSRAARLVVSTLRCSTIFPRRWTCCWPPLNKTTILYGYSRERNGQRRSAFVSVRHSHFSVTDIVIKSAGEQKGQPSRDFIFIFSNVRLASYSC